MASQLEMHGEAYLIIQGEATFENSNLTGGHLSVTNGGRTVLRDSRLNFASLSEDGTSLRFEGESVVLGGFSAGVETRVEGVIASASPASEAYSDFGDHEPSIPRFELEGAESDLVISHVPDGWLVRIQRNSRGALTIGTLGGVVRVKDSQDTTETEFMLVVESGYGNATILLESNSVVHVTAPYSVNVVDLGTRGTVVRTGSKPSGTRPPAADVALQSRSAMRELASSYAAYQSWMDAFIGAVRGLVGVSGPHVANCTAKA